MQIIKTYNYDRPFFKQTLRSPLHGMGLADVRSLADNEFYSRLRKDVRLRASEAIEEGQLLVTPAIGSAVIVGSLSGDLTQLVILAIDRAESIVINGGKLGGLINIEPLTQKMNDLIQAINSHTHQGTHGPTGPPLQPVKQFNRRDYEDSNIKH